MVDLTPRQIELLIPAIQMSVGTYTRLLNSNVYTKHPNLVMATDKVTGNNITAVQYRDKHKDKWLETIEALKTLIDELEDKSNRKQ